MGIVENVVRAIKFESPEYVPMEYLAFHLKNPYELSDIVELSYGPSKFWKPSRPGETEWGFVFDTADGRAWGMGRPCNPPLTSWDKLTVFSVPDPYQKERFEAPIYSAALGATLPSAKTQIDYWKKKRYILGGLSLTMFSLMQCLRGDTMILIDMYKNRDEVEKLGDVLLQHHIGLIEMWSSYGADGVIAYDDWGTQRGLFAHPRLFREIFIPRYKKMVQKAHEHDMHFFLHCCGYIYDVIEDMINAGIDVLQLDQPELAGGGGISGIDRLAKTFGGRICFMAGVDIQATLVKGSLADIENEAKYLIEAFGSFDGGFIARPYVGPQAIGLASDSSQYEVMYKTFRTWGKYPKKLDYGRQNLSWTSSSY